ncbi:DUF4954 family protein [Flavilitoribacter nigricans]|uniref:DUF4954 domain-containing protein n=1 Tax=Flavilitoribacter nigricans (strain ATCC 23147 / DSM 23189 / NBRC 102662 / NCIMB 1420 / SS-2) TaxID=1122177 RepID=A0A2D0NJF8_FLAN2|nr:DUF4954 family protein [Flavilitoribacter nigricans]PHN08634.1 DUF4954 domain-containing protein [Flavilitoribacter nigricans DSM 23189 = NBRC 102662]
MGKISRKPLSRIGYDFILPQFLEPGQDEYHIRYRQFGPGKDFRRLTASEIEALVKNENVADNWEDIWVSEAFDPNLVRNCHFHGRVRIGALEAYYLEFHELRIPVGLYNSTIISCDIGNYVAIKNVQYLAYYIIGDETVLFNVNEMQTTSHAKFGNGILKEGESEHLRIWLEICNENGNRKVLPFEDMLPADACLWARTRDDRELMAAFKKMTDNAFDQSRGYYGTVGTQCVIKNTESIKDVKIGSHAYIKGANKLKNLTIKSSEAAPSQIGEGVELVNGIMGYGSRAFYGVKAVRFILGENSTLKYGARLINSILGDNSTISCCEVLNSLLFPGHEQHHNNSFLIAATVLGQSNIAAGATIGSNHNSRGADGEIIAGRGFWPGLCVSLKHNSKFAAFCLLTKGDFPAELHIHLPFSLVANNESEDRLEVIPAFWWQYNMYALARNAWKYGERDQRTYKQQSFETDFLAPDTVAEMFHALSYLEEATARAFREQDHPSPEIELEGRALGKELLLERPEIADRLIIRANDMEHSAREVRLLKVTAAYRAYREMLHFYGVRTLLDLQTEGEGPVAWENLRAQFGESQREDWFNLGGQLIARADLDRMLAEIKGGDIDSWKELHARYVDLDRDYRQKNAANAYASLLELHGIDAPAVNEEMWRKWVEQATEISWMMARRTKASRQKDYDNPFRQLTYNSAEEMEAVQGALDANPFIREMASRAAEFADRHA